jgi:hypothetical protein
MNGAVRSDVIESARDIVVSASTLIGKRLVAWLVGWLANQVAAASTVFGRPERRRQVKMKLKSEKLSRREPRVMLHAFSWDLLSCLSLKVWN